MGAEIDRLEIIIESQVSKASKELDALESKLNKIALALSGIDYSGLSGLTSGLDAAGKSSSGLAYIGNYASKSDSKLKRFVSTMGNYAMQANIAHNRTRNLAQSFGLFYATFFPIIRGIKAVGKAMESSMDYIETYNYFNVTMGKIAKEFSDQWQKYGYDSAESYADSFSGRLNELTKKMSGFEVGRDGILNLTKDMNLGMDPEQIMNYQANIAAVTNSVGLVGESSVNTAKALSMLAADMSSFKNVELSTVMTNFQSGLIGQSRALYKYGIDITNATLQTYAYKYGLSTAVSEMTQADKMQLRLLAILDQSRVAWGDQANTINSVANQYRILKQQISNVARMIGNLLMPVIQAVLPVFNGLIIAVQRLLNFVGRLFGIDFTKIMDGISSGYGGEMGDVSDDTSDVADNFDKASKKAAKLQRTILGFDQIHKLNDDSDSESGGSASGDSGVGGIDLSNEIAAALADYEAVWNKAFENSVNQAQSYADKICAVFRKMWRYIRQGNYESLGAYIASGVENIFSKINSVFNWSVMGPTITEFVDAYCRTVNSIVDNIYWQDIGKTIGDGFNVITNTKYLYLTGIDWVNIGVSLANGLNGIVDSVDWDILGRTIGAWIMKIPKIIYGFVTTLDWAEVGKGFADALNGVLQEFDGETIAGGINGIVNGILTMLSSFIKNVDWSEVAKAIGDVLGNLDWGTFAKIGLALAAVKIAGLFGGLLSSRFKEVLGTIDWSGVFKALSSSFSLTSLGIIAGIAIIVAGIIDLWNTSETFRDNVKNMLGIIGSAFADFKQKAWDEGLKPLWDSIKELFGSLYQIYEDSGLKDIFEIIITGIGYIASFALAGLISAIGDFIKFLANGVQQVIDRLNVILDYIKDFLRKHKETIDGLKQVFHGLTEFLAGAFSGDWRRAWNGIKEIFSGIWNTLGSIVRKPVNVALSILEGFANGVISAFNTVKRVLNGFSFKIPKKIPIIGGAGFDVNLPMTSKISIPRFEKGGFPNTGEMFLARENGITEMIGRMGSRTTVANNDQIVSGIASGVKSAIVDAVAEVAIAMSGSMGTSESAPVVEVLVKADSETIYRIVQKGKKKADRRYEVVVPMG